MDGNGRDYIFVDLAEEGGNQFLPRDIDYFGSVAVPEEQAVMEYVGFFGGKRPSIVYKGKGMRFAYFMPQPKESEVQVNHNGRGEQGK